MRTETQAEGSMSSLKNNWWFIGSQLEAGLNDSQDQENGTTAKNVAIRQHSFFMRTMLRDNKPDLLSNTEKNLRTI